MMVKLTDEQTKLLILLGSPDDGSQHHVADAQVLNELIKLGLVRFTGKMPGGTESIDLTDAGECLYDELTG